jgi:hypothetical protein
MFPSIPLRWLYFPVRKAALLGAHKELVTNAFLNNIPSAASLSILGVWFIPKPYELMAWYPWSSLKMKTILGRCCEKREQENNTVKKRDNIIFIMSRIFN